MDNWKTTFLLGVGILALALIFHGLLVYNRNEEVNTIITQNKKPNDDGTLTVNIKNAPIWGKPDAPVTLVEYSDFECPFCKKAYDEILPQLKKDFIDTGKIRFIYRNDPLKIHTNAKLKAVAALCAKKLKDDGAFYAFHNQLYSQAENTANPYDFIESIALSNGLKKDTFNVCVKNTQSISDQVDLETAEAAQLGADGTPTWFVGKTQKHSNVIQGIRIVGTQPYSVYRILITQLLQE